MAISLGKRLDDLKGIGPGFDHWRVGLSLSILTWHSFSISYGQHYGETLSRFPLPVLLSALLPMFFGLSGFLIMSSALRTGELKTFITFRVLRILPALFTEIMVSALILGPLLTSLPLGSYFSNPMFLEYFGSLIGRVRFSLPGLFLTNPAPEIVNFALWTVGPEILCYVIMSIVMLTGIFRSRKKMTIFTLLYCALAFSTGVLFPATLTTDIVPPKFLILAFLSGNLIFLFRDRLPFSLGLSAAWLALSVLGLYVFQSTGYEGLVILAIPGFVFFVATVGLSRLPPLPFFHRGDYSYGIYIFGFPIQQAIAHFLPDHREWYVNLALALPITLVFAVASWHFVEKPVLGLRKVLLARRPADPVLPSARFGPRKAALLLLLLGYGLFVIDASNVLPTRPGAKMLLYGFGMYRYKDGEPRPAFQAD